MLIMTNEVVTTEGDSGELAVIEAAARLTFDAACVDAQSTWHNRNEQLHRDFEDGLEDNATAYRAAITTARRIYRDAVADTYR
jgi:hypothetical protein